MQMHVVYETLRELGVMGKKIITLFNKQDVPGACVLRDFKSDYSLKISARTGQGAGGAGRTSGEISGRGSDLYGTDFFPIRKRAKFS